MTIAFQPNAFQNATAFQTNNIVSFDPSNNPVWVPVLPQNPIAHYQQRRSADYPSFFWDPQPTPANLTADIVATASSSESSSLSSSTEIPWLPAFPDAVKSVSPSQYGWYAFVDWAPPNVPTSTGTTWNPSGNTQPGGTFYPVYSDFAKSYAPPANTGYVAWNFEPDPNIRKFFDSWLPIYPDFTRTCAPLTNTGTFVWDPQPNQNVRPFYDSWLPIYPDFAARSLLPLVSTGYAAWTPEPDSSVRKFFNGWLSDYPDFPARTASPLVTTGYIAWVPRPDETVRKSYDAWAPAYPDFARSALPLINTGSIAWTAEPDPSVRKFFSSWIPYYPDFPARIQQPNVAIGFIGWTPEPSANIRSFATSWYPAYPDFVRSYQPLVNTGLTALVSEPNAIISNFNTSWLPAYPDITRSTVGILAANQLVEAFVDWAPPNVPVNTFDVSKNLSWLPVFPDFSGRTYTPLVSTGYVAWTPALNQNVRPFNISWLSTYPDFSRAVLPLAPTGYFSWVPEPDQEVRKFYNAWVSAYPDFVRATQPIVNTGSFAWAPEPNQIVRAFNSSWLPSYPDFPARSVFPLVATGHTAWTPEPNQNIRSFYDGWLPLYPDFTRSYTPQVPTGIIAWVAEQNSSITNFASAWLPTFVDFTRTQPRTIEYPSLSFVDWAPPNVPVTVFDPSKNPSWLPTYSDFARSITRTVEYRAFAFIDIQSVATLNPAKIPTWLPIYSDFARSFASLVNTGFVARTPERNEAVRKYFESWYPTYPDFARAAQPIVNIGFVSWLPEPNQVIRPYFSAWLPVYPDFALTKRPLVNTGFVAMDPATDLSVRSFAESWLPTYSDFARTAARVAEFPNYAPYVPATTTWGTDAGKVPWMPIFPDFARSREPLSPRHYPYYVAPLNPTILQAATTSSSNAIIDNTPGKNRNLIVVSTINEVIVGSRANIFVKVSSDGGNTWLTVISSGAFLNPISGIAICQDSVSNKLHIVYGFSNVTAATNYNRWRFTYNAAGDIVGAVFEAFTTLGAATASGSVAITEITDGETPSKKRLLVTTSARPSNRTVLATWTTPSAGVAPASSTDWVNSSGTTSSSTTVISFTDSSSASSKGVRVAAAQTATQSGAGPILFVAGNQGTINEVHYAAYTGNPDGTFSSSIADTTVSTVYSNGLSMSFDRQTGSVYYAYSEFTGGNYTARFNKLDALGTHTIDAVASQPWGPTPNDYLAIQVSDNGTIGYAYSTRSNTSCQFYINGAWGPPQFLGDGDTPLLYNFRGPDFVFRGVSRFHVISSDTFLWKYEYVPFPQDVRWNPTFPDFILPAPGLSTPVQQTVAYVPAIQNWPFTNGEIPWIPLYPDFAVAKSPLPSGAVPSFAMVFTIGVERRLVDWLPVFPDFPGRVLEWLKEALQKVLSYEADVFTVIHPVQKIITNCIYATKPDDIKLSTTIDSVIYNVAVQSGEIELIASLTPTMYIVGVLVAVDEMVMDIGC